MITTKYSNKWGNIYTWDIGQWKEVEDDDNKIRAPDAFVHLQGSIEDGKKYGGKSLRIIESTLSDVCTQMNMRVVWWYDTSWLKGTYLIKTKENVCYLRMHKK